MDLTQLIQRLLEGGDVDAIRTNARAQFGRPEKRYLGATILPEQETENEFTESAIRFRTVIAADGDRYSPAQKRGMAGGAAWQTMEVRLGNSDIAREFTGRDYDGMLNLFNNGMDMAAAEAILEWLDVEVNLALVELNEKQRWDAITNSLVMRRGDNNYVEPVFYHNPAGHRLNAGGVWSDPTYDPWPDILAMNAKVRTDSKAPVDRIVYSTTVENILLSNPKIIQRIMGAPIVILADGTLQSVVPATEVSNAQLANLFRSNGMPTPEIYDEVYNTQVGEARFTDEMSMYFFCKTPRRTTLRIPGVTQPLILPNTLGYVGIGRPVGKPNNGRAFYMAAFGSKPPRIEGEGWQTSLPVIQEPLAIGIIKNIS